MDWIHILDDPDPEELDRMMKVGQLVTWPKVGFILRYLLLVSRLHLPAPYD
jgi:hypothetical protein